MKPTPGRIVIYTAPPSFLGAPPEERAAVIVRVRHAPCACGNAPCTVEEHHLITLRVFGDTPMEDTAVPAAVFAPAGAIGCWMWPPRV